MAREGKGDELVIMAYSDVAKKARAKKFAEDCEHKDDLCLVVWVDDK
jgi:hypothetical protein